MAGPVPAVTLERIFTGDPLQTTGLSQSSIPALTFVRIFMVTPVVPISWRRASASPETGLTAQLGTSTEVAPALMFVRVFMVSSWKVGVTFFRS